MATHPVFRMLLVVSMALSGKTPGQGQTSSNSSLANSSQDTIQLPNNFKFEPPWRDKGDCGPLALYLLMRLHARDVTIGDVKRVVPFDPDRGCSLADLEKGAQTLGFPVETRFVNPRHLEKLPFPFVVHTEGSLERQTGHFDLIVDYHADERKYSVIDITFDTIRKVPEEAILKKYTGYVLLPRRPQTSRLLGISLISLACTFAIISSYLVVYRKKRNAPHGMRIAGPATPAPTNFPGQ